MFNNKPKPIRHIAGKYLEKVQQCTRCLKILVDSRNVMVPKGQPDMNGFPKGVLTERIGWPTFFSVGNDPEAIDCERMLG